MTCKLHCLALMLAILSGACSSNTGSGPAPAPPDLPKPAVQDNPDDVAVLETDRGKVVIRFFPEVAPKTVANFKKLARSGFYSRTTFHRVIPGTIIQGGDPLSRDNDPWNDGTGNSGEFVPAEFNNRKHVGGAVSMARGEADDSASSQFFIVLKNMPQWDRRFTVFGEVVEGLDVAERISRVSTSKVDKRLAQAPVQKQWVQSVRIVPKSESRAGGGTAIR